MKKLNDYIVEQEINESRFGDIIKKLFKSGDKAMKTNIKNKFADKYPNWYKEFEALEKVTDVEEAKKTIDALLAAVDDMTIFKDDNEKVVSKLTTLSLQKINAEKTKNKELIKWIDSKIDEMSNANPEAQKQFEDELKQGEKENSSEGGEETINPGVDAADENPKEIKNILDILKLGNDVYPLVAGKMYNMFKESLSLFEGKTTANEYYDFAKQLYKDDKSKQEMNLALTTLFLAYEKLKECAKNGGGKIKIVPDAIRKLLSEFDKTKQATKEEMTGTTKNTAEQK